MKYSLCGYSGHGRVAQQLLLLLVLVAQPLVALEVTDYRGRSVQLKQPAKRIVALAPHIVENAYSAGAGGQLVAAVNYSDYPEQAQQLPQLGSYKAVSVERILALEPDLVLMWATGNGENLLHQLDKLGVTVYVDEPRKLEDVARSVRDIGKLAGSQQQADAAAQDYLQTLAQLRARYGGETSISVFYQVWNEPLQTLSDDHLVSDVIRLCGGRNIFADALTLAPKINMESVLDRDPQVIVASGMGEEKPEWLDDWRRWPGLRAVRHDHLFFVPPDLIQRHTLRILSGAQLLCEQIATARAEGSEAGE